MEFGKKGEGAPRSNDERIGAGNITEKTGRNTKEPAKGIRDERK